MPPIQTVYDNQIEVGWVGGTIVENLQTGEKILSSIKSYFMPNRADGTYIAIFWRV